MEYAKNYFTKKGASTNDNHGSTTAVEGNSNDNQGMKITIKFSSKIYSIFYLTIF